MRGRAQASFDLVSLCGEKQNSCKALPPAKNRRVS